MTDASDATEVKSEIHGVPLPPDSLHSHNLEEQLKETVERYELLAKATNDVVYDLDIANATVTWNDALFTQYGYRQSEEVSSLEWWVSRIHPDDAFRVQEEVSALLNTKQETWFSEYRFQKADRDYVYVRDRAFVQRDAQGQIKRIIGSFLDITQQKQLDRTKDEFLSLVSHQLRTPLTVIRMFSDMLSTGRAGKLSALQKHYAHQISDASVRMIALVGDILNISRLELDRITIAPVATDVNKLIATHIEEVVPLAAAKGAIISFSPTLDVSYVSIDPTVFGQVIHNLLTNAVRYSPVSTGRIVVRFVRDGHSFLLSVHDNGIGIPAKARAHIFERFYRADNAVDFDGAGTGLGLYLVKLIVDACEGKIWVKSNAPQGTVFYVRLPGKGMQARKAGSATTPL